MGVLFLFVLVEEGILAVEDRDTFPDQLEVCVSEENC